MIDDFFRESWKFVISSSAYMAPWTLYNIAYYPIAYVKYMRAWYLDAI